MTETMAPIYSSRIIKASALIPDTRLLLAEWDLTQSASHNLERVRRQNVLGKASRKRVNDILTILRQRYFADPDVGAALVTLAQRHKPAEWLDPLLYFFAAQSDRTLHDVVVDVLYPRRLAGYTDLPVHVVERAIRTWVAEGRTTSPWGDSTVERVAQGVMATLRDFGVLAGTARKSLTPIYLPAPAFVLAALWLHGRERSGQLVLTSDEWRLFFLPVEGVERFFIEAHQQHLLVYDAAGSVVRIEFPADTLTEYVHVLLERAN